MARDVIDLHALVRIEAREIGDETFEDEHTTRREPSRSVANARHLCGLRQEAIQRARHDVDERVVAVDIDVGEVTDRHRNVRAAGLGAHALDHRRRRLDAMDGDATPSERDRDAACADAELECLTGARELGEYVDRGRWIEVRVNLVADRRSERMRHRMPGDRSWRQS